MKYHRFLSIPVLVVLATVGSIYYVTVFIFLEDWLGLQSSAGSLNALIFTFLASLCFVSFFACVLTDPGGVPSSYVPDVEDHATSDQQPIKTGIQRKRCDKCSVYKPPRTHHCRSCRRCILRMDHHCIWINNCVGLRNYKAFFVLVAYTTMASIYSSVIIVSCAVRKEWNPWKAHETLLLKLFYILSGVVVVGLSMTLGTLFCWHVYLVVHNMTTIEHYEAIRAAWLAKKSGQSYHHPFDVGAYKNLTLVLGPNMLKWLCPTAVSHIKDGITFPTARDSS
ncbi:Protein S-acyltransferase [Bertholletia excelsa]